MTATILSVTLPTFDLSYIVEQLLNKPETKGWTPQRYSKAINDYREYLALSKQEPGVAYSPTKDVDKIWHRHILNTKKYHADCDVYFGHYLHHQPMPAPKNTDCSSCGIGDSCATIGVKPDYKLAGCDGGGDSGDCAAEINSKCHPASFDQMMSAFAGIRD